jgi:brefeldin A-inhibited guanine nucleotide-exchange protein
LLDEESHHRNIVAWRPVVVDVIEGYSNFPLQDFERHVNTFYPLAVELLNRDLGHEVRVALQMFLRRVGEVRMGMPPLQATPAQTPTSPRSASSAFFGRSTSWNR